MTHSHGIIFPKFPPKLQIVLQGLQSMYFLKIRFATSKFHADASPQANDSFVMVMTFERKLYRVQILNC